MTYKNFDLCVSGTVVYNKDNLSLFWTKFYDQRFHSSFPNDGFHPWIWVWSINHWKRFNIYEAPYHLRNCSNRAINSVSLLFFSNNFLNKSTLSSFVVDEKIILSRQSFRHPMNCNWLILCQQLLILTQILKIYTSIAFTIYPLLILHFQNGILSLFPIHFI